MGLSGHVQRVVVLDELAAAMGRNPDLLEIEAYEVLWGALAQMERVASKPPPSFEDEATRHQGMAQAAVAEVPLDGLIPAFVQLRWHTYRIGERVAVADIEGELRALLARLLAERMRIVMTKWGKATGWGKRRTYTEPVARGDLEP
jgi:hypothetical protein